MAGYLTVVLRDAAGDDVPGGRILVGGDDHGATPDTIEATLGEHLSRFRAPAALSCPRGAACSSHRAGRSTRP